MTAWTVLHASRGTANAKRRPLTSLVLAAGLAALLSSASARATTVSSPPDPGTGTIAPGDDFNAYANAAWLDAVVIPADRGRWGWRDETDRRTSQALAGLIEQAATRTTGSDGRKVADFHAAYLDETAIEARGIAPLKPLLDRIAGVHDRTSLSRLLGSDLRADVDPLDWGVFASPNVLGLAVQRGIHGETNNFAYLLQGGLGLKDRSAYLDGAPGSRALRLAYRAYIGRQLRQAGFDHATRRAEAVMALETALARTHATESASADDRNADHHWTRADFSSRAPGMDWSAFFAGAGLAAHGDFVAWQPDALAGTAALVASQPLDVWKDYLRFHVIDRHADVLPRRFAEPALAMHAMAWPGTPAPTTRAQRAIEATDLALPEAVGRLYVETYFPPGTKAKVQAIVANVMEAFGRRIEAVRWMTPATKAQALAKLKKIHVGVGYPDRWVDDAGLVIAPHDAFGNQRRVSEWNYRRALDRLARPADATEWVIRPQQVAAIYLPLHNAYNFSAAFLQAPKFDPAASDATNYGAIGAVIGHEISHYFDTLGAEYDGNGAMTHWWAPEDDAQFKSASQPLVAQYAAYHPMPGLSIDGRLALNENIADLGGLAAAFDAYRRTLGDRAADAASVRTLDRQFFIGFARSWRVKMRDDAYRAKAATDHAPEDLRIATVRNLDAWYDAFDVLPGQALYLEPQARVVIW